MSGYICKSCGEQNWVRRESPSSFGAELVVWIVCLIGAAVLHWVVVLGAVGFSLWRFGVRHRVCGKCGSDEVIPTDSPLGRQLIDQVSRIPKARIPELKDKV